MWYNLILFQYYSAEIRRAFVNLFRNLLVYCCCCSSRCSPREQVTVHVDHVWYSSSLDLPSNVIDWMPLLPNSVFFIKNFWGHCLVNVWYEGQWGQYCDIAARKSWTLLQTFPCERNGDHILPSFVKTSPHRLCFWSLISIFCHTVIFFLHSQHKFIQFKIHFETNPTSIWDNWSFCSY